MRKNSARPLVELGADVEHEAGDMHLVARIGFFCRGITAQQSAQFIDAETGGDDAHAVIYGRFGVFKHFAEI